MTNSVLIDALKPQEAELIEIRREIHRHPEIGFEEVKTSKLVAEKLRDWGLEVTEGIAGTGVVGVLQGESGPGPSIALRADMDALRMQEVGNRAHGSMESGKMHACGHDGHTAMLLGAARYLAKHRDFAGTVVFIFQPAEEGLGGAKKMVEEGLFEKFPIDSIYGMHNWPGLPVGEFRVRTGPMFAASDSWQVTFHGTGGHGGIGAYLGTDATLPQAHFVLALQTIVSRNVRAADMAVVSVAHIAAGMQNTFNIIPAEVTVAGTARSFKPEIRDMIERRLRELAEAQAHAFGCRVDFSYNRRISPVVTHAAQTEISASAARTLVGNDKVLEINAPVTGAEDFAYFLERKPGSFILVGNGVDGPGAANLHTPEYDFNDNVLSLGTAYWVQLVQDELQKH